MKQLNRVLWGIALVAVGLIIGLNALGVTEINLFFDGWWTLFIIVPCLIGLFSARDKTANLIGLCIGVCLLLSSLQIFSFDLFWKLLIPAVIVIFGLRLIFSGAFSAREKQIVAKLRETATGKESAAVFSGVDLNYDGEIFQSADLSATFGGLKCDLRGAVIESDCFVRASAVFGGIVLFVPEHVRVKVSSTSIFGGVSEKKRESAPEGAPTLYVNATCLFGGVDIK